MTIESEGLVGKPDWPVARRAWEKWWRGEGLALHVTAPRETPLWDVPPAEAPDFETQWLDPEYRLRAQERLIAGTYYGGVAFPMFDTQIGPGSLGLFLGCGGRLAETTVWYDPVITDPEAHPPLRFEPAGEWWDRHVRLIAAAAAESQGRYLVSIPDLIENLDTLAQLRDPQTVLMDLVQRPEWVERRIDEINVAFMEAFDRLWEMTCDPWGGSCYSAFAIWGIGRTAKIQCDICCAISPAAFRRFVMPAMSRQCEWLDHSLFHLDGTQAMHQLDNLLSMEALQAIEWTPQYPLPGGGSPEWYDLYRRIRRAGKSVQALDVRLDEVEPLLDAVGPEGMLLMVHADSEAEAQRLLDRYDWSTA
jgi:5-methyltetrahydrofolate--homocysteine methyltransferase